MNYSIIKNKIQYKAYSKKLFELGKKKASPRIQDEMELLELLIDKWEKDNLKNESLNPVQLLKYLMQNNDINRNDLINVLGVSKGTLSKILNYKKGLSKKTIRLLSEYFNISQEAFNRPYELKIGLNKGHQDEKMMNTSKSMVA